jgi:hypothetical protein
MISLIFKYFFKKNPRLDLKNYVDSIEIQT